VVQQRTVRPNQQGGLARAGREQADVAPGGFALRVGLDGEPGVAGVEAGRGELVDVTVEQGLALLAGASDRGRGGDHLGSVRGDVDSRLVEADQCAERAGDEVQLVLDDEFGRWGALGCVTSVEQCGRFGLPGHLGELVDRGDDQRGPVQVDRLVDQVGREPVAEIAVRVAARRHQSLGAEVDAVVEDVDVDAAPAAAAKLHGIPLGQRLAGAELL